MSVTLKQLAEFCGLSAGTVSKALNRHPAVNQATSEYVIRAAQKLGYVPNRAGKALSALKKPLQVGALLPSVNNPFFDDIKQGMQQAVRDYRELGLSLNLKEVEGWDGQTHLQALTELEAEGCGAFCLCCPSVPSVLTKINCLKQTAAVACINHATVGVSPHFFVGVDFYRSGLLAANLAQLRFKGERMRLLIVIGLRQLIGHQKRIDGFLQGLSQFNADFEVRTIAEGRDNAELSQKLTALALDNDREINCVYIATGSGLSGACAALQSRRARELFVIGTDDMPPAPDYLKQGILQAVICQDPRLQGYQALVKLYKLHTALQLRQEPDLILEPSVKLRAHFSG